MVTAGLLDYQQLTEPKRSRREAVSAAKSQPWVPLPAPKRTGRGSSSAGLAEKLPAGRDVDRRLDFFAVPPCLFATVVGDGPRTHRIGLPLCRNLMVTDWMGSSGALVGSGLAWGFRRCHEQSPRGQHAVGMP